MSVRKPPTPDTSDGSPRRVGVEIEFAGVDLADAADIVAGIAGGKAEPAGPNRMEISTNDLGEFIVELDAQILHPKDDGDNDAEDGEKTSDDFDRQAREILGKTVAGIVPLEIVTPPLPWDRLDLADDIVSTLRRQGAKGTSDNPLYGFGLHLNPEIASEDAAAITRQLRAYLILADWLRDAIGIDGTRRLLPHADPFPRAYRLKVADPDYAPDLAGLIADYLDDNPTRNRELDMLPLFKHLDEAAVTARIDDPLIKARPTYHYRLPNCDLSNPDWNVSTEWDRWVRIEELAADEKKLNEKARQFRKLEGRPALDRWLDELKGVFGE